MKFYELVELFDKFGVSEDVKLKSDSGWECSATEMNGVFYNEKENLIVFTQANGASGDEYSSQDWVCLTENYIEDED